MTRHDSQRDPEASDGPTANCMGDVDHTHPHRNTTFGSVFGRGPTVAADGGSPVGTGDGGTTPADDGSLETMADVDHESPTGTDADGWFERGVGHTSTEHGGVAGADPENDSGAVPGGVASDE